jgi:hypothetical protein
MFPKTEKIRASFQKTEKLRPTLLRAIVLFS